MSTYWGYVCVSHDPPLESEHWFNHGEDVLVDAFLRERAGEWPNDPSFTAWDEPVPLVLRGYETTSPISWLREHPRCEVALRNEYGDIRPIGQGVVVAARNPREIEPTRP